MVRGLEEEEILVARRHGKIHGLVDGAAKHNDTECCDRRKGTQLRLRRNGCLAFDEDLLLR